MDLKAELEHLAPRVARGAWHGYEYVKGYGIFGLPFSSGHVLALRVFPENDFSPYITIWHRDPAGSWAIHYDAVVAHVACPRYYGAASRVIAPAHIDVTWEGPDRLRVRMDRPALEWTVEARETPVLRVMNAMSRRLPFWTWKYEALRIPREWMAWTLGLGRIKLAGVMPSGHFGVLMPQRMYFIERSDAVLDGENLGRAARVRPNPRIGEVPLPARGVLAVGQAHFRIGDAEEYERTRREVGAAG